jgi:hypothetical protein
MKKETLQKLAARRLPPMPYARSFPASFKAALDEAVRKYNAPHTARTHTEILLGNDHDGHVMKIICDSTGGIVELPWNVMAARESQPYLVCQFCGAPNRRWAREHRAALYEVTPVDTDTVNAWPAVSESLA